MAVYVLAIECPKCKAQLYTACHPDENNIMWNNWVCEERIEAVKKLGGLKLDEK